MSFSLDNDTLAGIINPNINSPNLISGQIEYANYNYNIHISSAVVFTVLFGLLSSIHLYQAIRSRYWFLLYTVSLGGFIEMGGWAGRLASATSTKWDPTFGGYWASTDGAFLAQICMLIFAPAFIVAGCYVILGVVISRCGYQYCRLHPKTYTIMFLAGDLTSLVIQAIGGGVAASADTHSQADQGARIMVGGVIFQMVVMVAYTYLLLEFSYRYIYNQPTTQLSPFAWMTKKTRENARRQAEENRLATASSCAARGSVEDKRTRYQLMGVGGVTLFIFIRSVYRTIELLDGWSGPIISNQSLFDGLDGAMIILSLICLNVAHPVFLMGRTDNMEAYPLVSVWNLSTAFSSLLYIFIPWT
ncbi:RTA-like protein [Phaffia rhodozyma]|uniref:RTA-like protein n=1 Tax=Phaffia rhodozyma TaxID=264483 RepID=A0A0F7SWP2_PHARH|nr:RTA-like protein [Phaffia rhodozyma]